MNSKLFVSHNWPKRLFIPFGLALPALSEALGATDMRISGQGVAVATRPPSDVTRAMTYALMDVTARPKDIGSIIDFSSVVDAAVEALGDNDCLVLFDGAQSPDFWRSNSWGMTVALNAAERIPFLVEIRGASMIEGSVVFTSLLDERVNQGLA